MPTKKPPTTTNKTPQRTQAKFEKLARQRMTDVLLRCKHCCNLAVYPHTDEQAKKINDTWAECARKVEQAFKAPDKSPETFEF